MKAYCRGCRFYRDTTYPLSLMGRCIHPDAQRFSRVNGYYSPYVFGTPLKEQAETLKDCDDNGWFEPIPARKKLWGLV